MAFLDFARQFWNDTKAAWAKLSTSARVNIGLAGATVMVVVLFVAFSGAPPLYRTLASDLEPGALSQVRTLLDQQGVDYHIESDDTVKVSVSAKRFDELRLAMADADIPITRGVLPGFEDLLDSDIMANKWMQDMKYMVALQGQLQSQLNEFSFVDYSLVTIREAKTELFRNNQQDSEAAVTLGLTRSISNQEKKSIVDLIAASGGPHLSPNNIVMMDTEGRTLWSPTKDGLISIANSRREQDADLERAQEARIRQVLEDIGVRATVTVSAKTSWDEIEETENNISEGQPLSESIREVSNTSNETLAQGPPGVTAAIPDAEGGAGNIEMAETESEIINNYENGSTFKVTKRSAGSVVQYQAAVVIAEDYEADTVDPDGNPVPGAPIPLTEEDISEFETIASAALASAELAPVVTVTSHPFRVDRVAAGVAAQAQAAVQSESRKQMAWQAAQILMIILFFFMARVLLRRLIQLPEDYVEEEEVAEIPEATREDMRRQEVAAQIAQLAEENPEMVALLLRAWINESND